MEGSCSSGLLWPLEGSTNRYISEIIEVAIAPGFDAFNAGRVYDFILGIQERDGGQVVGENLLDFDIFFSPPGLCLLGWAAFGRGLCQQLIDLGVDIVAAVCALRWKAGGRVHIAEDVGVFVRADPLQHVHLKGSVSDVCVEGAELGRADLQRDACITHLLLKHGCQLACGLVGADLEGQGEPDSVLVRGKSRGLEQPRSASGIVRVLRKRSVIGSGPVADGKQGIRELRMTSPQGGDDCGAIDRECHCLAHLPARGAAGLRR